MPPIFIGTRGSALALAQANFIAAACRAAFPALPFELQIIKTTGDKLQTASLAQGDLPKGLFTKELEVALLDGRVDLCVHSLKDLPTELPAGLVLGATPPREDVRDVLFTRDPGHLRSAGVKDRRGFGPHVHLRDLPADAVIATSSTRRRAQLLAARADLRTVEIRGNVATRLHKLARQPELDATLLAYAGLRRLGYTVTPEGRITGTDLPPGLFATVMELDTMLPCVGQAAIGIEIRGDDARIADVCARLNHADTLACVTAERAFLAAMGGGCQAPVAAHATVSGAELQLRAVSFLRGCQRAELRGPRDQPIALGQQMAECLR